MSLIVYVDSEYGRTAEPHVTPICCALDVWEDGKRKYTADFWVWRDEEQQQALWNLLSDLAKDGATIVSFAYNAECRFFTSIGLDPLHFPKAIDLYLEYRMLGNHLAEVTYGKHLVDGKVKFLKPPPRYKQDKEELPEGQSYQQIQFSLASASFKFLGVQRDTKHKDLMRELCIRGGPFTEEEAQAIMQYCVEDTKHLHDLHEAMWKLLKKKVGECEGGVKDYELRAEQHIRADYARRSALMEDLGYPVDVPAMRRLSDNIPYLIRELQRDVNKQLEGVIPFKVFEWDKKTQSFKRNVKLILEHLEAQYGDMWPERTETKQISISEEALSKMISDRHSFRPTLVDQLYRFARFQQSINGFRPPKDSEKKTIWDSLGSDGRVRPYLGIYGAQSSRTQPAATGFIFLKSAVFRGLVAPRKGRVIVASDYGQQEFLVAAILSGDKKMLEAYKSGDVYLYFAKDTGAVPKEATKKSHPEMRDRYKSSVLGMSYLMGCKGLANKVTNDTGVYTSPKQAQVIIDQFDRTFSTYAAWRAERIEEYVQAQRQGYGATIRLGDGWRMFGDNPNYRSVANIPIQGFGAVAMRCAVARAQNAGLDVLMTLHDAIYPEIDFGDWGKIDLFCACMDKGFEDAVRMSFGGKLPAHYTPCRQDPQAWGPDFGDMEEITTPGGLVIPVQSRYADKRAKKELARWAPLLWPDEEGEEEDI